METFTLIIWFYASGLTRHETRTPGLSEIECKLQAAEIRRFKRATCVHEPVVEPKIERDPICAHGGGSCAWPLLPGRKRV